MTDIDLVYIVKQSELNPELRYSLRSIERFCHFRKVWIVGFKPSWVRNVEYIRTDQLFTKWKNSIKNIDAACRCEDISSRFILMNDDFVALREITDWGQSLNVALGTLDQKIEKFREEKQTPWRVGFRYAKALLTLMDCSNQYDFEAHTPMIIDRHQYLRVFEHPLLSHELKSHHVLHKRTIYKNLTLTEEPRIIRDVKIPKGEDLESWQLSGEWLSFYDRVVDNITEFPKAVRFLKNTFKDKSRFEE